MIFLNKNHVFKLLYYCTNFVNYSNELKELYKY